jgi:hypothetical protein
MEVAAAVAIAVAAAALVLVLALALALVAPTTPAQPRRLSNGTTTGMSSTHRARTATGQGRSSMLVRE